MSEEKKSQKTGSQRKVKIEQNEKIQFESLNRQIMEIQLRIGNLEVQKNQEIENLKQILGMRSIFWRDLCKRYELNPVNSYRIKEDGEVIEVSAVG